jgi:hypothetical protein
MPSLSSFLSTNQYTKESTTVTLLAGMQMGSIYAGITFNGVSGAAGNDPGGLFGWLIYSRRYRYTPQKGTTGDQYIVYTNPQDLAGDLNKLSGITAFMISPQNSGGTYGMFEKTGVVQNVTRITPRTVGNDFLHAINYLAYGGTLVIVGGPTGFTKYQTDTNKKLDVIIGQQGTTGLVQWLISQNYSTGIFPSVADASGITGNGLTMADYANLSGNCTGEIANRLFNVYGVKTVTDLDTASVLTGSKITYSIPAVGDVGGFFTRSKNRNKLYLTVAGVDLSKVLNGNISNGIEWSSTLKESLKTNRLNFFVNNQSTPNFLGADLVGATANPTIIAEDRIGVSKLKSAIYQDLTNIGMKYMFQPNDTATRTNVTSEIRTAISKYSQFIFTTATQITCDSTNNTDFSSTLDMAVVVQPILSLDSFEVSLTIITQ